MNPTGIANAGTPLANSNQNTAINNLNGVPTITTPGGAPNVGNTTRLSSIQPPTIPSVINPTTQLSTTQQTIPQSNAINQSNQANSTVAGIAASTTPSVANQATNIGKGTGIGGQTVDTQQSNVNSYQGQVDQTTQQINDLMTQLGYKSQDSQNFQQQYGVNADAQLLKDLNSQLLQKTAAYNQQFQQIGAQNIPSTFISGQLALAKQAAAVDIAGIAAQVQGAQGNLKTANDQVTTAINLKYQPIIDQIDAKQKYLQDNRDNLTSAQKVLADRQSAVLDAQKTQVSQQVDQQKQATTDLNTQITNSKIDPQTGYKALSDLVAGKITLSDFYNQIGMQQGNSGGGSLQNALAAQESGGDYSAVNKDSGALGKYQILPSTLKNLLPGVSNTDFLASPALQDKAFDILINQLSTQYGGDQSKMAAAYYGGSYGASVVGTPKGDIPIGANGKPDPNGKYPSINSYVNSVLSKASSVDSSITNQFLDTPAKQTAFNALPAQNQSNVANLLTGSALLSDLVTSKGIAGQGQRQQLIAEAQKIDPTFSENTNKIRYAYNKDWNDATTTVGKTKVAINTALNHLADVSTLTQQLAPSDLRTINSTKNWINQQTGNRAITNLQFGLTQLASEIAAAYKGGQPTDSEVKAEKDVLGTDFSKGQFQGVYNTASNFLSGKISSLNYNYKSTMGSNPPQALIDPATRQALVSSGIDPNQISKDPNAQTIKVNGIDAQVGQVYTNAQGKQGRLNADGTITPL
jgi:hypothetical protein